MTVRFRILLVFLFVASWLGTAVATAPLAAIIPFFSLPDSTTIEAQSGTPWHGEVIVKWTDYPPTRLAFDLNAGSLFRFSPEWAVSVHGEGVNLEGLIRPHVFRSGSLNVPELDGTLYGSSPYLGNAVPWEIAGRLSVSGASLQLSPIPENGELSLTWSNAGFEGVSIESVDGDLRFVDGRLDGQITSSPDNSTSSPAIDLKLESSAKDTVKITGMIDPRERASLDSWLRFIGERSSSGAYSVTHNLSW